MTPLDEHRERRAALAEAAAYFHDAALGQAAQYGLLLAELADETLAWHVPISRPVHREKIYPCSRCSQEWPCPDYRRAMRVIPVLAEWVPHG